MIFLQVIKAPFSKVFKFKLIIHSMLQVWTGCMTLKKKKTILVAWSGCHSYFICVGVNEYKNEKHHETPGSQDQAESLLGRNRSRDTHEIMPKETPQKAF
jgi:hypothetical protein